MTLRSSPYLAQSTKILEHLLSTSSRGAVPLPTHDQDPVLKSSRPLRGAIFWRCKNVLPSVIPRPALRRSAGLELWSPDRQRVSIVDEALTPLSLPALSSGSSPWLWQGSVYRPAINNSHRRAAHVRPGDRGRATSFQAQAYPVSASDSADSQSPLQSLPVILLHLSSSSSLSSSLQPFPTQAAVGLHPFSLPHPTHLRTQS